MKVFKIDERQQKKIEGFFKEELSYDQNAPILKYVACLLAGLAMMLLLVPFRAWEEDGACLSIIGYVIFAGGLSINNSKYKTRAINNTNKYVSFMDITRFLPVDPVQLIIFRIRKIFKPCAICMLISMVFRCLVSYAAYGMLSPWDFILPLGSILVIPLLTEGIAFANHW